MQSVFLNAQTNITQKFLNFSSQKWPQNGPLSCFENPGSVPDKSIIYFNVLPGGSTAGKLLTFTTEIRADILANETLPVLAACSIRSDFFVVF